MHHHTTIVTSALALLLAACAPARNTVAPTTGTTSTADSATGLVHTFDDVAVDTPPPGLSFGRTGGGALGRWLVRAEDGAPSGANVLAQLDTDDTDIRFPIAVLNSPVLRDVRVSVRCKMVSGKVDQACGLVARYLDDNNYYLTRANALEDNIRLYTIRDGQRRQLASWSGGVTLNAWHEYRFEVLGDHITVSWDGQPILDHHDTTFTSAGRAGVWTKADSVTYFDDLRAEAP